MASEGKTTCICEKAVRYTYYNLIKKSCNPSVALESAYNVLKHHHPEIPNEKIPNKVFSILIENEEF